jgi:hypothetical protein
MERHEHIEVAVTIHHAQQQGPTGMPPSEAVDAFVAAQGYSILGERWVRLSRDQALVHLQDLLQWSLAYREQMVVEAEASEMARAFVDCFDPDTAVWFTNGARGGWNSISKSTFENALVAIDDRNIVLVLFEDED